MSEYKASITREQFLFYEMRITAKLMIDGLSDDQIYIKIMDENLFQFPTEKSVKLITKCCLNRLHYLNDHALIDAVANRSSEEAKQICLYAMMKQHAVIWDFMISVIGEKYRLREYQFGKIDLNVFFARLQEQNDIVSAWKESTIAKIKQVIVKILVENEYLDDISSDHINPVWLNLLLENAIKNNGDEICLPAFNCFI